MLTSTQIPFSIFIAFYTASTLYIILGNSSKSWLIYRYALKTNKVSTIPFRPAILFKALMAI
jgi:hypothetical protein